MLRNRRKVIIILAIVAAASVGGYLLWFVLSNTFDATDYEKITLHYHASDLTVDTDLSADEQEIIAEAIGKQISWDDGSSCGFSEYATLTFVPSDDNQASGDNAPTASGVGGTPASSESPTSPAISPMKIACTPQRYMTAMSSTPGIRTHPVCAGADRFVYTSDTGKLFTWIDSIISDRKTTLTLPAETPAYWSPDDDNSAIVMVTALDKSGKVIATGEVKIEKTGDTYSPAESENVKVVY